MSVAVNVMTYPEPGKVPSVVLALLVHVLLATFLFFGVRWQSKHADAVEVELWTSLPALVVEKPVAAPEPVPVPVPKPEVKPEPKIEKAVEPPKPDIALAKKKEPPKKPEPKLNFDLSRDIRAQAERELAPLNRQREKDEIVEQMKREAASAAARADAAYIAKLKGKIRGNIVLPPNIPGNPEAIFDVVQLPTGEIMDIRLRKSSGHKPYDDAVERAIRKASPLPKPDRQEQFQRNLEIKFKPLD